MFMKLLKAFLLVILFVCFSWLAVIFFGPNVVLYALDRSLGGSVKAHGLKISPKLELYVARLEISSLKVGSIKSESGLTADLRAITISPEGFFKGVPSLIIGVGPTEVEGYGKMEGLFGRADLTSFIRTRNINVNFDIKKPSLTIGSKADYLKIKSNFNTLKSNLGVLKLMEKT